VATDFCFVDRTKQTGIGEFRAIITAAGAVDIDLRQYVSRISGNEGCSDIGVTEGHQHIFLRRHVRCALHSFNNSGYRILHTIDGRTYTADIVDDIAQRSPGVEYPADLIIFTDLFIIITKSESLKFLSSPQPVIFLELICNITQI